MQRSNTEPETSDLTEETIPTDPTVLKRQLNPARFPATRVQRLGGRQQEQFCERAWQIGLRQARRVGFTGEPAQECAIGFVAHICIYLVRHALEPSSLSTAWLLRSALNWARNTARQERRLHFHETSWTDLPVGREEHSVADGPVVTDRLGGWPQTPEDPCLAVVWIELRDKLVAAVARLSPQQRDLFIRHYLHGETASEIAAGQGRNANATRQALWAMRCRLRHLLLHEGVDAPEASDYLSCLEQARGSPASPCGFTIRNEQG